MVTNSHCQKFSSSCFRWCLWYIWFYHTSPINNINPFIIGMIILLQHCRQIHQWVVFNFCNIVKCKYLHNMHQHGSKCCNGTTAIIVKDLLSLSDDIVSRPEQHTVMCDSLCNYYLYCLNIAMISLTRKASFKKRHLYQTCLILLR